MVSPLPEAVEGATTGPVPRKLITTIWRAGHPSFAGGSAKFETPTKKVEAWPQTWRALLDRIRKGQKLPRCDDKREHPHLGLYHSPEGFRSNRPGDIVVRTGLHVDIDEGASEATADALVEVLRAWGLAAVVQRRDVIDPPAIKLRAIVPLVPDEGRETFHSRASAFLQALSDALDCPIDMAPAVWSQPTFLYGPVTGREKPRIVATLEGEALDLHGVAGVAWASRIAGEDCAEAVALCRAMFEAAGSTFSAVERCTRPPDGDNPGGIEILPEGDFRCWTRPTPQVRAWLKENVPAEFEAWWRHPGRRIERARSALRTRDARATAGPEEVVRLEQLAERIELAAADGGQHVFLVPPSVDARAFVPAATSHANVLVGPRPAVETLVLPGSVVQDLRAQTTRMDRAAQERVRRAVEAITTDLFFAGRLPAIPQWTPTRRPEGPLDVWLADPEDLGAFPADLHDVIEASLARARPSSAEEAAPTLTRMLEEGGPLRAHREADGTLRVVALPRWTQEPFVLIGSEVDPALAAVCPGATRWRSEVHPRIERRWRVALADVHGAPDASLEPDLFELPRACLLGQPPEGWSGDVAPFEPSDARPLQAYDHVLVWGLPLREGWHPDAGASGPRPGAFWRAMEEEVERVLRAVEQRMRTGATLWYVAPSFPAPPWSEADTTLSAGGQGKVVD